MRKFLTAALLAGVMMSGCHFSTEYGACKGLATEKERDPNLRYEVSTWNVVWALIGSETLLIPGLTAAFWVWCPVGKK